MNTAFSPSIADEESAFCGPSSISAMTANLTNESPRASTTSLPKDSGVSSEVLASILVCTKSPFTWLGGGHHLGIEGEVHQRVALPGLLGDDGVVRLARQNALHLGDLGQHVGHGPVGIGIELQVQRHRAHILRR